MAIGYGVELAERPVRTKPTTTTITPTPRVSLARQVAIVLGAVFAYFLVRGATEGSVSQAVRNAGHVRNFERLFGLDVEGSLQSAVAGWPVVTTICNWIYIWGHWPVIVDRPWSGSPDGTRRCTSAPATRCWSPARSGWLSS